MRRAQLLVVLGAVVLAAIALSSVPASAVSCEDEFTAKTSSEWGNTANWTKGSLPTGATIVCWASGLTPVVTGSANAASISSGGGLTLEGGSLTLAATGEASSLSGMMTIESGSLSSSSTIDLTGAFAWSGGDNSADIKQTGGKSFKITGGYQTSGGVIETTSAVEIEGATFISNGSTLKTTSTVKFGPGSYPPNGGTSEKMTASGYITTGATAVPNYELNLTGNASKIEGGTFAVPILNTEAGTTMTVSSGASVFTTGGKISGKVTGAGGYGATAYTTTLESGGTLSTASVTLEGGTLDVKSGAKYEIAGETKIAGGDLELAGAGSTGAFKLASGGCAGAGPLTITGAFTWESGDCSLSMRQTGGNPFKIIGTHQAYQTSGSVIETTSPIEIESNEFISNGTTLKTTSTVKFAPGSYPPNGGTSEKMTAAGYITTGETAVPNYELNLTGNSSKVEGGIFAVPILNTEAGTTMTVSSGASVSTTGGKIFGKITGAGGYIAAGYTTTLESGGTLSTATAKFENGTLDVKSGAKYEIAGETKIAGGDLELAGAGSTGAFKLASGGCAGAGPLTVTGTFTWESGDCSLSMRQTGGNPFKIIGTHQAYQTNGSVIETTSPIEIESNEFISNGTTLKTTSTVTFVPGSYPPNGGASEKMYANGYIISGNTSVPNYNLHMTGGTTTIPNGDKLAEAPMTIEGGETLDEGELQPAGTLDITAGELSGLGTVDGSVENTAGTVEPGHGSTGSLDIVGSYTQGAGGNLSTTIHGAAPVTDFGQLVVGSSASLGGDLSVTDSAFTPASGEQFLVVKATGFKSGAFAALTGPSGSLYEAAYEPQGVLLTPAPTAPVNTQAPTISGTPVAGHTLTCSTGSWSPEPEPGLYEYEWNLEGSTVAGPSKSATYPLPSGDEGKKIVCVVTATREGLKSNPATSGPVTVIGPPTSTEAPSVSGTPATGQTLSCSNGVWTESPTGYTYEWKLEGTVIPGASESTYKVPAGDEGKKITCVVTATNGAGSGTPTPSAPVTVISAAENKVKPAISGVAAAGEALSCSTGTWSGTVTRYTYQWSIEGTPIAGATSSTYTVLTSDEGHTLTCTVTAYNGESPIASVSIAITTPPLELTCSGQPIVLVTVRQSGRSVVLSGFTLEKYVGKTVTITLSAVPSKVAKGKGGSTTVTAGGAFEVTLPLPTGRLAAQTRYTATVEGQHSSALKLGRQTKITGYTSVPGGATVSLKVAGPLGHNKGIVTVTLKESCSAEKVFAKLKLSKAKTLTLKLAAPTKPGETIYYRAQTKIAGGTTYSLPIGVSSGTT
jgi:hypothetical protein